MASPSLALASLSIRDFRGIDQLDLDFRGPDGHPNQLVVLAGPNGSGKTAVLEAALIAAGGDNLVVGPKGGRASRAVGLFSRPSAKPARAILRLDGVDQPGVGRLLHRSPGEICR
ncbi:AAA family ATPase [Singulisphaera rosea]